MADKEDYISFIQDNTEVPIFFQPWWLDSVSEGFDWDVCLSRGANDNIEGVFVYQIKSRLLGFQKSIHIPILTPYLGIWFFRPDGDLKNNSLYSFDKKTISKLIDKIPSHLYLNISLHPQIKNTLPFHWGGYKSDIKYTYLLHLEKDIDEVYKGLKGSVRTDIKKADKLLTISVNNDSSVFYKMNSLSFERQGMDIPYSEKCIHSIFSETSKRDLLLCLSAQDKSGNLHAQVLIVRDKNTAYLLATGADEKYRNSGAISLLIWEAIKSSKKNVQFFDFEGGNIQAIEKVFRAFGGSLTPYISLKHTPNKLSQAMFSLFGKM